MGTACQNRFSSSRNRCTSLSASPSLNFQMPRIASTTVVPFALFSEMRKFPPATQTVENLKPRRSCVHHSLPFKPSNDAKAGNDGNVLGQRAPVKRHVDLAGVRHLGIDERTFRIEEEIIRVNDRHVLLRMMKPFGLLWHDVVAQFNALSRTGLKHLLSSICRLV